MQVELGSLKSVLHFVDEYKEKGYPLHLLINNAGVMACPYRLSEDNIELQFATNHLGHFLLTTRLLEVIEKSAPSRIVNLSSLAHSFAPKTGVRFDQINDEQVYDPWTNYGQSKLCNILFSNELNRRLGDDKQVYVNSVHPGYVNTELQRNMKEIYGSVIGAIGSAVSGVVAKSPANGSLTTLYVATSPDIEANNIRGQYFVPTAKQSQASGKARNAELAKKLWEFSEALIAEKLGTSENEEEGKGKSHKHEHEHEEEGKGKSHKHEHGHEEDDSGKGKEKEQDEEKKEKASEEETKEEEKKEKASEEEETKEEEKKEKASEEEETKEEEKKVVNQENEETPASL